MKIIKIFLVIILLNITNSLFSQNDSLRFYTKVSKKTLTINEKFRVDFKFNVDGNDFNPPNFEGFKVVGGPNQSVSNMYVNGKRKYNKTYSYFLVPIKKGLLSIGSASIEYDRVYETKSVNINVPRIIKSNK
ncbi:BatD family protein [Flavobacteriaceae bacterium]|nr:BatD family protein [Flavobacteriaceae bacterium]